MFGEIDLDCVFGAARQKGYLSCEIYVERSYQTSIQVQNRLQDVRVATLGGVAMRCFDGTKTHHFSTPHAHTHALLRCLEGENDPSSHPKGSPPHPPAHTFNGTAEKVAVITTLARHILSDEDTLKFPQLAYRERVKHFAVANSDGISNGGKEEEAECVAQWVGERQGRPTLGKVERSHTSVVRLLDELRQEKTFLESVRHSVALKNPWPSPCGEIPVRWSARALSKLYLQFLRAFEGDLVIGNGSFLTAFPFPLELPFTLEDKPDPNALPCDHEGSPTRSVTIFDKGCPKTLAVNNRVASLLSVPTTGHCRRQSFETAPTVGFWQPSVSATQTVDSTLHSIEWGLSVRDLEVLRFNPATGAIRLRLTSIALIHHGEEGEAVEPIELRANLLDLLQSLEVFSRQIETIGLAVTKNHQRWMTEVSTPSAISRPLPIPGQVPLSHYW